MANIDTEKLLQDQRVIDEINRHLWIESEKAGYDIGFEQAKKDWLKNFAKPWATYHMPEAIIKGRKAEASSSSSKSYEAQAQAPAEATTRKRRAKSYI